MESLGQAGRDLFVEDDGVRNDSIHRHIRQVREQENDIIEVGVHDPWSQLLQKGQADEERKGRVVEDEDIPDVEQFMDGEDVGKAGQEPEQIIK